MLRLADSELSNGLSNKFFEDAAFFKKELSSGNRAYIPKPEVEALNIDSEDKLDVLFMGLDGGEVLLNKSKNVVQGDYLFVTIPKNFLEELNSNNEFIQIALRKSDNPESLLPSGGLDFAETIMGIGGVNFFESTMLYKAKIYEKESDEFILTLPKREAKYMSVKDGQSINVSIIELDSGERITVKDRSKFRVNARDPMRKSDNMSFRFTIPVKRARMRGYKKGQLVQVIARPARLDI